MDGKGMAIAVHAMTKAPLHTVVIDVGKSQNYGQHVCILKIHSTHSILFHLKLLAN